MTRTIAFATWAVVTLSLIAPAFGQAVDAVDSAARGGVVAVSERLAVLESLVAQLQTDLAGAQGKIGSLQSDLTAAQGRIGTLEGDLSAAQDRIESLETNLIAAQGRIGTLETDLFTAQGDIVTLTAGLGAAGSRVTSLEGSIAGLQEALAINEAGEGAQNEAIIELRIDLSKAGLLAQRSETRSYATVANNLSLRDANLLFRHDNTKTVAAIDETLGLLAVFRCQFNLLGCTDPTMERMPLFALAETAFAFESTVGEWESKLTSLRSFAASGIFEVSDGRVLDILDDMEEATLGLYGALEGDLLRFALQERQQTASLWYQTVSNIMKATHDAAMTIIRNIRA